MKAALIDDIGVDARYGEAPEPEPTEDDIVIEVVAASLNPVDLAVAKGNFYGGHPPLPFVPGIEAVGTVDGRMVYGLGGGAGIARNGTVAERVALPEAVLIDIPVEADPQVAAALGTAGAAGWLPLSWRARVQPGEIVLILGATGTAGRVALQAARALRAGKVVIAGRSKERLEELAPLADAAVWLGDADLAAKLVAACDPGADVIFDPLWGTPLETALAAAAADARIVHVGASAGALANLPSAAIRGKRVEVLGYSNFGVPRDVMVDAYLTMVRHSIEGTLVLDVVTSALEDVSQAWQGLELGGVKQVVVP